MTRPYYISDDTTPVPVAKGVVGTTSNLISTTSAEDIDMEDRSADDGSSTALTEHSITSSIREGLVEHSLNLVLELDMAFSTVDREHFRELLRSLRPSLTDADLPCEQKIRRRLKFIFRMQRAILKQRLLANESKLSLTLECWASPLEDVSDIFMGVTAHWIDETWTLQHTLLDFVPIVGKNNGVADTLHGVLKAFGIRDKVAAITSVSDSGSYSDTMMIDALAEKLTSDGIPFQGELSHIR